MKMFTPGKAHMEAHYADLKERSFFPGLVEYSACPLACPERTVAGAVPRPCSQSVGLAAGG